MGTSDSIVDIVRRIDDTGTVAETLLDFTHLAGVHNKVSPHWGAVLANVLAHRYRDRMFLVDLPESAAANRQMARAGLHFALSRHPGLNWNHLDEADEQLLSRWRQNWEPAIPHQALFDVPNFDDRAEPAGLDEKLVAFLNADSYPRHEAEQNQAAVLHPWLRRLVRRHGSDQFDEAMLVEVSRIISELLQNVRHHAQLSADGLCSVSAFMTRGSAPAGNLLYLSVFDTGIGMPATLEHRSFPADVPPARKIKAAFNGEMPSRARDRGRGLHRITCLVNDFGGSIFAATGSGTDVTYVINRAGSSGEAGVQVRERVRLSMNGTVVVVALPLRRSTQASNVLESGVEC